ncbi:MAG: bifunctional riboflavin kinase/FAD synthetase [Solobacterium sp.]|nr:bifunctional riboflavin kinase/FAD synthetase [Solobacterium sp.]
MRIDKISLSYQYKPKTPVVACIGFFDGVHRGHQALIKAAVDTAKELNCANGLITFEPDPWVTIRDLSPEECEHLTTTPQKINLVSALGIQNIYLLDFTKAMSMLHEDEFIEYVLGQLNLQGLVCGYDFRFGMNGRGDAQYLQDHLNVPVQIIDEVALDGEKISSSRIVSCVKEGDFLSAYKLLGYPYTIDGKVMHGNEVGSGLGFPTANISFSPEYVIPKLGVYSAHVKIRHKRYGAMINVGHNPTLNYSKNVSIEAHIFDFNEPIYGEHISVIPEQYIRPEQDFSNRENLIMQLERDRAQVRKVLGLK